MCISRLADMDCRLIGPLSIDFRSEKVTKDLFLSQFINFQKAHIKAIQEKNMTILKRTNLLQLIDNHLTVSNLSLAQNFSCFTRKPFVG